MYSLNPREDAYVQHHIHMGINAHSFAFCVYTSKQNTIHNVELYRLYNLHSWVSFQPQILPFARKQTFTRPWHEQVYPSLTRLKLNNKLNSQKTLFQLVQKALKNLKYMLYQIYYIIQVSVVYFINPARLHPLLMVYLVRNAKLTTLENTYFKINFQVHYLKKINCSSKKKIYIYYWLK